jgi:hypothetical protein
MLALRGSRRQRHRHAPARLSEQHTMKKLEPFLDAIMDCIRVKTSSTPDELRVIRTVVRAMLEKAFNEGVKSAQPK